jgi:hypothetical protein
MHSYQYICMPIHSYIFLILIRVCMHACCLLPWHSCPLLHSELNPRLEGGSLDLKEFCELRPGLIGWAVINLGI